MIDELKKCLLYERSGQFAIRANYNSVDFHHVIDNEAQKVVCIVDNKTVRYNLSYLLPAEGKEFLKDYARGTSRKFIQTNLDKFDQIYFGRAEGSMIWDGASLSIIYNPSYNATQYITSDLCDDF